MNLPIQNPRFVHGLFLIIVVMLFFNPAPGAAQTPPEGLRATAGWTPSVYHIGDLVPLEISLPLSSPDFFIETNLAAGKTWGGAHVVKVEQIPPDSYPGSLILRVTVQFFAMGSVQLPRTRLTLHRSNGESTFSVNPPPLSITPLLPPGPQPEPPFAPPLSTPLPFPWVYAALGVLVLAGALAILLWLLRRTGNAPSGNRGEVSLKERDPHLWAVGEIERLFRADITAYRRCEALSRVLREYLEVTLKRPFMEWTTHEIRTGCADIAPLAGEPSEQLFSVLSLCDRVLFARFLPGKKETLEIKKSAMAILERLPGNREEATP